MKTMALGMMGVFITYYHSLCIGHLTLYHVRGQFHILQFTPINYFVISPLPAQHVTQNCTHA
jgi:hypothetical protein